jgi:hypothetical protein
MVTLYSEKKLREKLAISPTDFRRIRNDVVKLRELEGWVRLKTGAIALTPAGLSAVLAYLPTTDGPLTAVVPEDFADCAVETQDDVVAKKEATANGSVEMTVMKIWPNRRLLRCKTPAGELVNVWVMNNAKFLPRMTLKAAFDVERGQYRLVGRCPRRKGRW